MALRKFLTNRITKINIKAKIADKSQIPSQFYCEPSVLRCRIWWTLLHNLLQLKYGCNVAVSGRSNRTLRAGGDSFHRSMKWTDLFFTKPPAAGFTIRCRGPLPYRLTACERVFASQGCRCRPGPFAGRFAGSELLFSMKLSSLFFIKKRSGNPVQVAMGNRCNPLWKTRTTRKKTVKNIKIVIAKKP